MEYVSSPFVWFWSHSACYFPIMSANHVVFSFYEMENVVFPPCWIILPLHAKAVTKVVATISTPSHHSNSLGNDHHIMPFVDVEVEECIEHVSDKKEEEGMEDDRRSYGASMHGSTLNVLISLWTWICVSKSMLYFHLYFSFIIFRNVSIISFLKPTWILEILSKACPILGLCLHHLKINWMLNLTTILKITSNLSYQACRLLIVKVKYGTH